MRNRCGHVGAALLVVAVALTPCISGAAHAAAKVQELTVNAGALNGIVTDSVGKPLSGIPVKVALDKKIVAQAETNRKGEYSLTNLPAGKLEFHVASEPALKVVAAADSAVRTLQIVVPQASNYGAAVLPKLATAEWIWVGVGATAVAVATPVIVHNTGGHTTGSAAATVSP